MSGVLVGRAAGYFALTLLWFMIWMITLGVLAALPLALHPPLGDEIGFRGGWAHTLGIVAVLVLLVPAAFGVVLLLVCITTSQMLLSALAFSRSLRRSYADEKITGTLQSNDTIGASMTSVALSLLPRRPTGYSTTLTHLSFRAWLVSGTWFLGLWALSYVYFLLLFIVLWPIQNPLGIVGVSIAAAACAVIGALRLRTGWRALAVDESGSLPRPINLSQPPLPTNDAKTDASQHVDNSADARERRRQNYLVYKASASKDAKRDK